MGGGALPPPSSTAPCLQWTPSLAFSHTQYIQDCQRFFFSSAARHPVTCRPARRHTPRAHGHHAPCATRSHMSTPQHAATLHHTPARHLKTHDPRRTPRHTYELLGARTPVAMAGGPPHALSRDGQW